MFQERNKTVPYKDAPRTVQWNDSVCWSEACVTEAAALRSSTEPSINPCDDFYAYVCSRWSHARPLPREQAVVSFDLDLLDVFTLDAYGILSRPSANPTYEGLRSLLAVCVATPDETFKSIATSALASVELRNWPYQTDSDADGVSLSTISGKLIRLYGLDPLFGLSQVSDPTSPGGIGTAYDFTGPRPILNE